LIWTVPKEHTKAKKADRPIPITKSMRAVLDEMHKRHPDHSHDALIFPSEGTRARGGQLSSSTPRNIIRSIPKLRDWCRANNVKMTAHGFRSTLKGFCRAHGYHVDWWKIQVDHALGNKSDTAYDNDTVDEQRRRMMEHWDKFCSTPEPQAADVINLSDKRRSA
jgi:integrase